MQLPIVFQHYINLSIQIFDSDLRDKSVALTLYRLVLLKTWELARNQSLQVLALQGLLKDITALYSVSLVSALSKSDFSCMVLLKNKYYQTPKQMFTQSLYKFFDNFPISFCYCHRSKTQSTPKKRLHAQNPS